MKSWIFIVVMLAGCAAGPRPAPTSSDRQPPPAPAPAEGITMQTESIAVASMVQNARAEAAAGRLTNAAASSERALRIEPRNPRLWNELARVRLQQRDYAQTESLAARSNSFVGSDSALRVNNWQLIAQSREARGDSAGARKALEAADRLK